MSVRNFEIIAGQPNRGRSRPHSLKPMLWNPEMTFPDVERAHLRKAKQTKKGLNPFDAVAKRNKKEKIAESSSQDEPTVIWKPVLPAYSAPLEDSGASMAAKSRSMERAPLQAQMHFL